MLDRGRAPSRRWSYTVAVERKWVEGAGIALVRSRDTGCASLGYLRIQCFGSDARIFAVGNGEYGCGMEGESSLAARTGSAVSATMLLLTLCEDRRRAI